MLKIFRNYDDIHEVYGTKNCRNLTDRLFKLYDIHRQPRPHLQLSIYTNKRCLFMQYVKPVEIIMDYKMDTRRKEIYGTRTNIF